MFNRETIKHNGKSIHIKYKKPEHAEEYIFSDSPLVAPPKLL